MTSENLKHDMPFVCHKVVCILVFLLGVSTTDCTKTDVAAKCNAEPAMEGGTGVMNISFSDEINLNTTIFLYFMKERGSDILSCHGLFGSLPENCNIEDGFRGHFKIEGFSDHNLTILIMAVSHEDQGKYELGMFVNGSPKPRSSCVLSVSVNEASSQDPDVKTTAVPVSVSILVVVLVVVVVVAVVCLRRRRNSGEASTFCSLKQRKTSRTSRDSTTIQEEAKPMHQGAERHEDNVD